MGCGLGRERSVDTASQIILARLAAVNSATLREWLSVSKWGKWAKAEIDPAYNLLTGLVSIISVLLCRDTADRHPPRICTPDAGPGWRFHTKSDCKSDEGERCVWKLREICMTSYGVVLGGLPANLLIHDWLYRLLATDSLSRPSKAAMVLPGW